MCHMYNVCLSHEKVTFIKKNLHFIFVYYVIQIAMKRQTEKLDVFISTVKSKLRTSHMKKTLSIKLD